jgi:hypothetical protein
VLDTNKSELTPHQLKQAETQKSAATGDVNARLPETYQWLLVPAQIDPQAPVTWESVRLTGDEALAERASKKLKKDDSLIVSYAASELRRDLDRIPLWRGDSVPVRQLVDDFARYLYLRRLKDSQVLLNSARAGIEQLTWELDAFAYAESYDDVAHRYRGLRYGTLVHLTSGDTGLLVKPDVARKQIDAETAPHPLAVKESASTEPDEPTQRGGSVQPGDRPVSPIALGGQRAQPPKLKRYHGTVTLDPARTGRDASRIADEVLTHLVGLVGANVTVTLEIDAEIPGGTPDTVVRTVTENSRTLKFTNNSGFEPE